MKVVVVVAAAAMVEVEMVVVVSVVSKRYPKTFQIFNYSNIPNSESRVLVHGRVGTS